MTVIPLAYSLFVFYTDSTIVQMFFILVLENIVINLLIDPILARVREYSH